jgi:hypothetical protein
MSSFLGNFTNSHYYNGLYSGSGHRLQQDPCVLQRQSGTSVFAILLRSECGADSAVALRLHCNPAEHDP